MVALDMGYRFSVLTVLPTCIARDTEAVYEKGFDMTRLASVRSIGIPVSDVREDMDATFNALYQAGRLCVEKDGAHCVVLSCLGMAGMGNVCPRRWGYRFLILLPLAVQYARCWGRLGFLRAERPIRLLGKRSIFE